MPEPRAPERALPPGELYESLLCRDPSRAAGSMSLWTRICRWAVRPWLRPRVSATHAFITALFGVWLTVVLLTLPRLSAGDLLRLLPIIALTALVHRLELGVYASGIFVTLGMVGNLAAGILLGVPGALATSAVAVLAGRGHHHRLRALVFNLAGVGLANGAAATVFMVVARAMPVTGPVGRAPGALAAGAVAYLCESVLVTLIVAITRRRSPRQVWEENVRWLLPHMMGLGLVALGLAETYRALGPVGLLAFVGPALLMRYSMKQYLDRTTLTVNALRARNEELQAANREIQEMTVQLRETYVGTLEALVAALDARDRETYGHSTRVAKLTMLLAKQMGVAEGSPEWVTIERGALLHDVGKIGVPDAILRKPGKLTDEEWIEMRRHARIGYEVLKDVPFLAGAAEIVAAHHEAWDGSGYPNGLAGEAIPLGARIFMVADAFDAMATDRPYRRARPYEDCLREIVRCSGTQFDPAVVDALLSIFPEWVAVHRSSLQQAGSVRMSVVA